MEKLLQAIPDIKSGKVFRGALWIVGEYCADHSGVISLSTVGAQIYNKTDIQEAFAQIRRAIGEIPILAAEQVCVRKGRLVV